jgi:hypothetical protein
MYLNYNYVELSKLLGRTLYCVTRTGAAAISGIYVKDWLFLFLSCKAMFLRRLISSSVLEIPQPTVLLNNQRHMLLAQLGQWVRGALALVLLAANGMRYWLLSRIQHGKFVSSEIADANDQWVLVASVIQLVVALLAFIALVQWFYRAYQNAHRLPNARPAYSAGMAIWGWLIPIINLWLPYKIMLEVGHYLGGFTDPRNTVVSSKWDYLVISWWAINILIAILARINLLPTMTPSISSSLEDLLQITRMQMSTQVVTILGVLTTLAILKTIAPHEQVLVAHSGASMPEADIIAALK